MYNGRRVAVYHKEFDYPVMIYLYEKEGVTYLKIEGDNCQNTELFLQLQRYLMREFDYYLFPLEIANDHLVFQPLYYPL